VPFTVDPSAGEASRHDPHAYIGTAADAIAIDLGPRAGLDARQRAWLQALDGRAALLMGQPNAPDLALRPATDLRSHPREAVSTQGPPDLPDPPAPTDSSDLPRIRSTRP